MKIQQDLKELEQMLGTDVLDAEFTEKKGNMEK